MFRLVLGLVKGAVIGGGIGYGAYAANMTGGFHWVTYGIIGAAVGLLVGRPFWSHLLDKRSTMVTSILKAIVGFGFGVGVFALVSRVWGGTDVTIAEQTRNVYDWQYLFGGFVGALYGAWVELDDAPAPEKEDEKQTAE